MPDQPPAFEAAVSNVHVQAGVPQNCMQVICPNCRILIALPPGMPRFLCPRCRTECMAPPMHHFYPQQQPMQMQQQQPMQYQPLNNNAPPPHQQMMGGGGYINRPPQNAPGYMQTPLPGSVSPGGHANAGGGYQPIGSPPNAGAAGSGRPGGDVKSVQAGAGGANQSVQNSVQQLNETRLEQMNWPRGSWVLSIRAFFLAQCPLLNFYWLYFMCCSNRSVSQKNRYQYEWYDTNSAKCGFTVGFTVFLGWLILYIAVGAKNHLSGYGILGSLLAVFFGPLILVVLCWEFGAWNRCGVAPGSNQLKDPCPGCNFDCGDCSACGCGGCGCDGCDCCRCWKRNCGGCCGNCDCGGCDCGGCDC